MFDINTYIRQLTDLLLQRFGRHLLYVGLQGSYLRGEATADSDMDIMVVLEELHTADLEAYRTIVESLDQPEKSCGFICSREDLANWNSLEIHHLQSSTRDYYGVLQVFLPSYTEQDIRNFVKLSLNNLYHELCHRYIHASREKNETYLPGTYKGVFFILQNLYSLTHGRFVGTKAELLSLLDGINHDVLARSIELNKGTSCDFAESFSLLLTWCQQTLRSLK